MAPALRGSGDSIKDGKLVPAAVGGLSVTPRQVHLTTRSVIFASVINRCSQWSDRHAGSLDSWIRDRKLCV